VNSTDPDDPIAARTAGADWLSLALMDARNRNLRWLAAFEDSRIGPHAAAEGLPSALWTSGHAAWYADWWVVRHVLAQRGEDGDPARPRLAAADPVADARFHVGLKDRAYELTLPPPDVVRVWMADTLEMVLELLAQAGDDDRGLYFYRQALRHEDRSVETLAVLAQELGLAQAPWLASAAGRELPALWMPAQRHALGSSPGGLVPGPERWVHAVAVPEFEIDAQPVSWARYLEFALDGGYDERRWWTPAGWDWAQRVQRRAPRHVEQLGQAVVLRHQGRLQRAAPGQPVVHVSRHEAEAWCAWAGRRLPTEPEWEAAACAGRSRGFVWGEVLEWVAGSARGWPGHADPPGEIDRLPPPGKAGVLRGACRATPPRAVHLRARRFAVPEYDLGFVGFRSCAV
jgi:formylglycine-generating enzyme required for sulfatase activity